jgi:hypothetical protein
MKIGEIIGLIRGPIKLYSDDSVNYSDEHLYKSFIAKYSALLSRKMNQHQLSPDYTRQVYCIPMVKSKLHNCECFDIGCTVMKSTIKIPSSISGRVGSLKVTSFDNKEMFQLTPNELKAVAQDGVKRRLGFWSLYDGHIVVWNKPYETIIVEGVFSDPTEFIELCDTECKDLLEMAYPGDLEIISAAIDMVVNQYAPKVNPDKING